MAWVLAMLDTIHGNLDENQLPFNFQDASLLITFSFDIARLCPAWPHKDCQRACTKGCVSGHGHLRNQVPDSPLQGRGASEARHGVTSLVLRASEEFEPEGSRDGILAVLTKRKLLFSGINFALLTFNLAKESVFFFSLTEVWTTWLLLVSRRSFLSP